MHLVFEPLVDFGVVSEAVSEIIIGAFNSIQNTWPPSHYAGGAVSASEPVPLEAYQGFADVHRLHFGQPENKLILPKANLHFPISTANKVTLLQFEKELEKQILRFRRQLSLRERVAEYLHGRSPTMKMSALSWLRSVFLSSRTLSRKFECGRASFSDLVTETRIKVASELLRHSTKSIGQSPTMSGLPVTAVLSGV